MLGVDVASAEVVVADGASVGAVAGAAVVGAATPDLTFLLFFLFYEHVSMISSAAKETIKTYLLPAPKRLETVEEPNIRKQIGVQPQSRRDNENGNTE